MRTMLGFGHEDDDELAEQPADGEGDSEGNGVSEEEDQALRGYRRRNNSVRTNALSPRSDVTRLFLCTDQFISM